MPQTTDFVSELMRAANTLHTVSLFERRRLIERGVAIVEAQRHLIEVHTNTVPLRPGFMTDMPELAKLAAKDGNIDVLVGAGMLMLSGEIQRLRAIYRDAEADPHSAPE